MNRVTGNLYLWLTAILGWVPNCPWGIQQMIGSSGSVWCRDYPGEAREATSCTVFVKSVGLSFQRVAIFVWITDMLELDKGILHDLHDSVSETSQGTSDASADLRSGGWCPSGWLHDDVIKWKHFPRHWPSVPGIHWSLVNYPYKDQWRGDLMVSLIFARINGSVNNREAGDLRRHRAHYDVIVMGWLYRVTMHYSYYSQREKHNLPDSKPSRDDCPFVTLRSTDMTVGKSVPASPVEHFCKLVRLMDTGRNQNLLCVPKSESCPLKIRAYFDTIR